MMKKSIFALFLITSILLTGIPVFAQDAVGLIIKETRVATDQAPFIEDGTTFVPIRVISENFGCEVSWDGDQQRVDVEKESTKFSLYIGMNYAITENGPKEIPKAPRIVNSRTMVPIRAVAELLDCKVDWLGATHTVYIDSPNTLAQDSVVQVSKVYAEKDWVYTANEYRDWYTDEVGNENALYFVVPAINLNSEDANAINREIAASIEEDLQYVSKTKQQGTSLDIFGTTYTYYINNDIISLGIDPQGSWEGEDTIWYNINKATGKRVSNAELVASLGYTESQFIEKLKEIVGNYYLETTGVNASAVDEQFYQDRYNYTISDEACNMNVPLFIGENGNLYVVAKIGSLAGASWYNHLVDTGIVVNPNAPTFTVGRGLECIRAWRNTGSGLQGMFSLYRRKYIAVDPNLDDAVIPDPNYDGQYHNLGYTYNGQHYQSAVPAYLVMDVITKDDITTYLLNYVTDALEAKEGLTEKAFELGGVEYNGRLYAYEMGFTGLHFDYDNTKQIEDADGYKQIAIGADHYNSDWIFRFKIEDGRWKLAEAIEPQN